MRINQYQYFILYNKDMYDDKTLKLLADPNKLKQVSKFKNTIDLFKFQLETKFNSRLNTNSYNRIIKIVKDEIEIENCINDIIVKVVMNHNP